MREPLLSELYAETKPGTCAICERPLPVQTGTGRKRRICKSKDCKRSWHRLHHAALRAVQRAARAIDRAVKNMEGM